MVREIALLPGPSLLGQGVARSANIAIHFTPRVTAPHPNRKFKTSHDADLNLCYHNIARAAAAVLMYTQTSFVSEKAVTLVLHFFKTIQR